MDEYERQEKMDKQTQKKNRILTVILIAAVPVLAIIALLLSRGTATLSAPGQAIRDLLSDDGRMITGDEAPAFVLCRLGKERNIGAIPVPAEGETVYTVTGKLPDGTESVNVLHLYPDGFYMESSTCNNQNCVHQGVVNLENRDSRVLRNCVICLPNQLTAELYTADEIKTMTGQTQMSLKRYQATYTDLFDTVTVVTGYAASEQEFQNVTGAFYNEMLKYHQLYDVYHGYDGITNLKTVNDRAGETVRVGPEIIALLQLAEEAAEFSEGRIDVTLGSMLNIWHNERNTGLNTPEQARLPEKTALEEAMKHTGITLLEIDGEAGTVRLTDPEAKLDVGALAKGFAVQQVCGKMPSGYMISVGGNVYATGPKPDGSLWNVGVQDPDGTGSEYLHIVGVSCGAVVTSGDYQRYYTVDGRKYHHIIDPETCMPGDKWRAVTVICPDSGIADALSTTLFLNDLQSGKELLRKYDAAAMWIGMDGQVFYSSGYNNYLQ